MEIENSRTASLIAHNQSAPVDSQGSGRARVQPDAPADTGHTSDRLSLTGEARQLKELEAQIAAQPAVDNQRVSEIRSAIDNGTFTVNPERIADKMLSLDLALANPR